MRKKRNILILSIVLSAFLTAQLIGAILLYVMGFNNHQASEAEKLLLSEETAWIDETGRYRITFYPQEEGGIVQNLKADSDPIGFYFGLPGVINFCDIKATNGVELEKEHILGDALFAYDFEEKKLTLHSFHMNTAHVGDFENDKIVFYHSPAP